MLQQISTDGKSPAELLLESRTRIADAIDSDPFRVYDEGHLSHTIPAIIWLVFLAVVTCIVTQLLL
jgi:hypothetical protein